MNARESFEEPAARPSDDRATTFQAVQGEPEHYSGEVLLVTAYSVLWLILLSWVGLTWRKQNLIDARVDALEREIAKADAASAKNGQPLSRSSSSSGKGQSP